MRYPRGGRDHRGRAYSRGEQGADRLPAKLFDRSHFDDPEIPHRTRRKAAPGVLLRAALPHRLGARQPGTQGGVRYDLQRFPTLRLVVALEELKLRKEIINGGFEEFPVLW
ncbi:hypothetical protein ABID08_006043 [Rhizobium binae]|uniref:Uncharacterized protein n=1 Tax=Rhizobium binae TaxID=1138190 RepID=A0ABV2MQB8_9HYPH